MLAPRFTAALAAFLLAASVSSARAQGAFTLNASASGNTVFLNWTPVPGATIYGLQAQVQGGPTLPLTPVGTATSLTLPNIPAGTYLVRASASNFAQIVHSNIVTIVVTGAAAATPAPASLSAQVSGHDVLLSWALPTTAGLSGLLGELLTGPGGAVIQQLPFRVSTSAHVPGVPDGIYTVRVRGIGAGGFSAPSNEVTVSVPGCGAPASLPLSVATGGGSVTLSWPAVPGVVGYHLNASSVPGGSPNLLSQPLPPNMTTVSHGGLPAGTYYVTLVANTACGTASSGEQVVTVGGPSGNGARRPAGSVGSATATAEVLAAGRAVASQSRGDLLGSCGNPTYLFKVLQRLRTIDSRYGLNWKRGVVGSMSDDVIVYNFSDVPDDQARAPQLYAWDIIGGHCGPNPTPIANFGITNPNGQALWTIQPYLAAGGQP